MRVLIAALLLSISTPAFADNIAGCEVVLMEKIKQEDNEGVTEIASFRPAADFIASAYDDETDVLREIDGLPIRAIMCKRKSVVPGESDFPIVATGTPFMISQNFDSTETGLTTIYFKDGEFRSDYKGPELSEDVEAEMEARLKEFNSQSHDLAEKEKAMQEKTSSEDKKTDLDKAGSKDELAAEPKDQEAEQASEETSTDEAKDEDDSAPESTEKDDAPAEDDMEKISPEEHEEAK